MKRLILTKIGQDCYHNEGIAPLIKEYKVLTDCWVKEAKEVVDALVCHVEHELAFNSNNTVYLPEDIDLEYLNRINRKSKFFKFEFKFETVSNPKNKEKIKSLIKECIHLAVNDDDFETVRNLIDLLD